MGYFAKVSSQTDSINLKQKLINANFKNINNYIVNNKGATITSGDYDSNDLDILPYSAESSSLFKISEFGTNLYTGTQDVKIPLFSIQEGNITIPVALVYQTSGIKVDQKASEVGLGWSLITAPEIKRKINIVNDWYQQNNTKKPIGYFRKIRENLPVIQNLNIAETSPDEYYTNLKGDRKRFIFLNENTPSELTKTGIKIQAQSYNFPNFSSYQPKDFNQFEITDNDGLIYKFIDAGFKSAGGESMELVTQGSSQINEELTVSDWKTSKITDVLNNTSVTIEYTTNPNNQVYSTISENSSVQFGNNVSSSIPYERNIPPGNQARWPYVVTYTRTIVSAKKYISKIIYSKGFLKFNYDEITLNYDNTPGFDPLPTFKEYVLKNVESYDNQDKLIKKYTFNYSHFNCMERENDLDLCAQRVKLESVEESGKGKYEFTYNNLPLYSYTSTKFDYLGYHTDSDIYDNGKGLYYYPGENEWSILPYNLPIPTYDPTVQADLQKIKIFNNDQTSYGYYFKLKALPFSNYSKAGILEKIKFPTGGEQNFEYEPNDFLLFGKYEVQGAGLRIKEITLKDQNIVQKRTKYEYKDPTTNKSSGLMIAPPFLGYPKMHYYLGNNFTEIMDEESSTVSGYFSLFNKSNSNDGNNFVGYGRVIKKYEDGSSEEFVFKNKNDDYDLDLENYSYTNTLPGVPQDWAYGSFRNQNSAVLVKYKNFQKYGNGKLLEKYTYNKTGTMLEKVVNNYRNTFSNALESNFPYYTPPNISGKWTYGDYKIKYITYFNDLISSTKTNYLPSGNTSETITYTYINDYSDKIKTVSSDNGIVKEKTYLFENNNYLGASAEYNLLNVYNIPYALESEKTKLNNKILDKKGIKYSNWLRGSTLIPRVSEIYNETLNGATDKTTKFISYTDKGNVRETLSDGLSVTTVWGYNDNYPIAQIIGAKYTDVENYISDIVNKSNLDTDDASENQLIDALDTFRKNTNLSNFQITTYTYNPLIGVTSVTPPSGMREIYIYDTANRLKEVKRQEKDSSGNFIYRTLSENEYHYKP